MDGHGIVVRPVQGRPCTRLSFLLQQLEILMNRSTSAFFSLAALACALPLGAAHADGDIARGKAAFVQCAACHSVTGANGVGPHLDGVFGREAGKVAGFRYSPNMQKSTTKWDDKTLDEFLAAPTRVVPGTTMPINVPSAQMRQDLVAYLKSLNAGK
jgi:cytochrome c